MSIKVLYVEDETFLGKIVMETLEGRGFEVSMETDGARALDAFRASQPDICVLDIMLPNRNGFEIAEDIRALNDDIPIIFLTAKTQTEDVVKGFRTGGNDYIRKPFSMEELIVRIENALRVKKKIQRPPQTHALLKLAATGLIQTGNYLFSNSDERKLSYRESELLKYLWQNRQNIIDRKDILNAIWGNDSFLTAETLTYILQRCAAILKKILRLKY